MNENPTRARKGPNGGRRPSPGLNDLSSGDTGTAATSEDRMAALESRLDQLERTSLRARGRSMLDRMMPPEASQHFRNAGREQLMGVRAIVDFWIRRIDDSERRSTASRETIDIE
jgi:hypothetical protein